VSVRIYVPGTLPGLASQWRAGRIEVTEAAVTAPDDSEDAEYAALMAAADVSAGLVAGLRTGSRRRLVIVVEVVVEVGEAVPKGVGLGVGLGEIVAVHVDPADDAGPDDDLAWFATQEIPDLL
jgi:hypothetical protein